MGVHQFLSWLRARHPSAFRTSRKLRSVEDDSFKTTATEEKDDSSSSSSSSDDDDTSSTSSKTKQNATASKEQQKQQQETATKKKKKTLSGSEDDYAVICLDINALLHEVATAVTTEHSSMASSTTASSPGGGGSSNNFSGLPNKSIVEKEILVRLRKQIEDLIYVAGGDALKFLQQEHQQQQQQVSTSSNDNIGVLTFDNLVEEISPSAASKAKQSSKTTSFNGHIFKRFDQHQQQGAENGVGEDDAAAANVENKETTFPSIPDQNMLPVDILLVIDGVAPVGKCPQQRERRATKKTPGTIQERTQQLLIQAAEQRSGRSRLRAENRNSRYHQNQNNNNRNNTKPSGEKLTIGEDGEFITTTSNVSISGGDFSSKSQNNNTGDNNNIKLSNTASSIWDGNAITVGTPFMQQVCSMLHYTAGALVKMYRNLRVFVSDASVPGEGEQKIFSALRSGMMCTVPMSTRIGIEKHILSKKNEKSSSSSSSVNRKNNNNSNKNIIAADETRRICVCSNDTDSIVMALLLSDEDYVSRPIDVWRTPSVQLKNLATQTLQQGAALSASSPAASLSSSSAALQQYLIQQQNATAWIFDMTIFIRELKKSFSWREGLNVQHNNNNNAVADISSEASLLLQTKKKTTTNTNTEITDQLPSSESSSESTSTFSVPSTIRKRTFGGAMKSFAFMLSLFGGDFLPRVSDLSIAEGDLDDVIQVLSDELFVKEQWIVDPIEGTVDLQAMHFVLQCLNERKYALDVVETNNNNTSSTSTGAVRRARTGEDGHNAVKRNNNLTLMMGEGDSNTFNPFSSNNNNNNNQQQQQEIAVPPNIKAFWEGIVWVGRYFDGVIINWAWFFDVGAGSFTSAINNHHSAPRLRDLVQYPNAFIGKPVEMASYASKLYIDQVEALQRGLGGQLLLTMSKQQSQQQKTSTSTKTKTITDLLVFQQQTDLFSEVNPIAFAAVVLPYYSWSNLLPRALSEELLQAYDRVRSQTLEEEKLEQDREDVNEEFKQEEKMLLDWSTNYAHVDTPSHNDTKGDGFVLGGTVQEKNVKLAKIFIRQQRNLKGFNPVKAVSAVMKLVINVQHKFSKDEARLLNKKEMYKMSFARLVMASEDNNQNNNSNQQKNTNEINKKVMTAEEIEEENNNRIGFFKNQHMMLQQKLQETMNDPNSEASKLWNQHFGPNATKQTTISDVLNLWVNSGSDAENKTSDSDTNGIFEFSQNKDDELILRCFFPVSSTTTKDDDEDISMMKHIIEVGETAEEITREEYLKLKKEQEERKKKREEHARLLEQQQRERANNKTQQDAAVSSLADNNQSTGSVHSAVGTGTSSSSLFSSRSLLSMQNFTKIGSISIPMTIKFSGLSTSSSAASVLSASLLKAFPTMMNQTLMAAKGGNAVIVQEVVGVV